MSRTQSLERISNATQLALSRKALHIILVGAINNSNEILRTEENETKEQLLTGLPPIIAQLSFVQHKEVSVK